MPKADKEATKTAMDIFLKNWLPASLLLLVSAGAPLFCFIYSRIKGRSLPTAPKLLLCTLSLTADIVLSFLLLAWGGGLEHVMLIFLFSLLLMLH